MSSLKQYEKKWARQVHTDIAVKKIYIIAISKPFCVCKPSLSFFFSTFRK